MTPKERAKQLAEAHWNGYIKPLMEVHGENPENIAVIGFHYVTSGIHFYGHAVEDCQNGMFGIFGDGVDHVALEAELDRSCGDAAADASHAFRAKELFTRGCPSCLDAAACGKNMKTDHAGRCLYHRLNLRERMLDAKQAQPSLCHSCHIPKCDKPLIERCEMEGVCAQYVPEAKQDDDYGQVGESCTNAGCRHYSTLFMRNCQAYNSKEIIGCAGYQIGAKQEAPTAAEQTLNFTLPSIALKCTAEEAHRKYCEENAEWLAAKTGSMEELVERWDCLQALRTYAECGGDTKFCQEEEHYICHDLTAYHAKGRDVIGAKEVFLMKNADRGYYSRAVNKRLMQTEGTSFAPKEADA